MKLKISDEAVLRMHELSMIGVDDKDIGKRMGVCTNVVARSLARVAPDGRVMKTMYGDKRNSPGYTRSGCSVGLVDDVPVLHSVLGRRHE